MNKPDSPELFTKAEGLFKRAKDASGNALRTARDAGKRVWERATEAPDEDKRRKKILTLLGLGIAAVIAVLFIVSRLGGDNNIETARASDAQAVSVVAVQMQTFETEVSLNGEARPVRDIQVSAPATGVRTCRARHDPSSAGACSVPSGAPSAASAGAASPPAGSACSSERSYS